MVGHGIRQVSIVGGGLRGQIAFSRHGHHVAEVGALAEHAGFAVAV